VVAATVEEEVEEMVEETAGEERAGEVTAAATEED